ncbi:MAG: AAA family ATPase, partial [Desulfobulbia bacterium]
EIAGHSGRYLIPARLDLCLDQTFRDFDSIRNTLMGDFLSPRNALSDYDHISTDRDLIVKVLEGAANERAEGVNILLYGTPGSGKTELTKIASKAAGLKVYGAGEDVSGDGESDRSGRLADLVFALRLAKGAGRTALLFDEMEDIAWQLIRRGGSKLYLNRLLETNPVPVLWTSNNISEIDPALLRRMTLAVELKLPPASQRQRILERLADRVGVELTSEEAERLARRLDATPAVLENALRAARFAGGGSEAVERAALGIVRAVSGVGARRDYAIPDFDATLSKASMDLRLLAESLLSSGNLSFSLCLSGPPGTGKSAFARFLAKELGLELLQKRASDLLGAFVGESEKRIAEAFEEAVEANALLVFDEADSLLYDRTQAVRSWEITQVNEMLTWMEVHPFPVCFTTNLMDRMDSASLRRFTFHIRFEFMDESALRHAYRVFFQ